ncbi:methyltransferase domain-containing protein [Flavobacterium marginilacus]|uniref:methyltransferase domain-containing protein n=1 Tax=Flavobacterium marginilacus TaxID=3003256 RepID=UPI00248EE4EA|nr:methyltransferase domain-containing protein [Flavobacterium marginilacus]
MENSNQTFWDNQYKADILGWDLGTISPPIKSHIDTLKNKNIRILIPGCGNSYEAEYLLEQEFTNITIIDIAPVLVEKLKIKFRNSPAINIILGDFFEHQGEYDLIIEQTFFCALLPEMREDYVSKMHQLLAKEGTIAGLLFNRIFESNPPFGGSQKEYEILFKDTFNFIKMEECQNSVAPRSGTELWIEFQKK